MEVLDVTDTAAVRDVVDRSFGTVATLRKRVADFEAQTELARLHGLPARRMRQRQPTFTRIG